MQAMRNVAAVLTVLGVSSVAVLFAAGAILCRATMSPRPRNAVENLPSPRSGNWRDVSLTARDGTRLAAWFATPGAETNNCVIVLHGVGDSRAGSAGYAPIFLDARYNVLLPNSRGHGASGGDLITYGIREKYDAASWIAWLRDHGCQHVFGLGESLGGAVLIQAAPITPGLDAIVAESSYSDLRSVAQYRMARMIGVPYVSDALAAAMVETAFAYANVRYGLALADASPIHGISDLRTPLLLIHGEDDAETPPGESVDLAKQNSRVALWLVPRAMHVGAFAADPVEFRRRVLNWFAEYTK
jgi:uncharacterized protein